MLPPSLIDCRSPRPPLQPELSNSGPVTSISCGYVQQHVLQQQQQQQPYAQVRGTGKVVMGGGAARAGNS